MKKTIPVSHIASMIYQIAKNSSSTSFDSKEEWKKAMKQAWETVHSTKESRRKKRKEEWNKQEAKRKEAWARSQEITKNSMDEIKAKLAKQKNKTIGQKIAEGAFNEDKRMIQRGIIPKVW